MNATEPQPFRWTKEQYYRLCEQGMFNGRRVELIGGKIVEMAAQLNFHGFSIKATEVALEAAFGPNFWVRAQLSLDLSPHSVPDPDLAVIAGSYLTHRGRANPTTAVMVVEISDTTLYYDRGQKMSLYAASGIADYWIVNIPDRQVEVYRDPVADVSQPFGYRYDNVIVLQPGDMVSPLAVPTAQIPVTDLLP